MAEEVFDPMSTDSPALPLALPEPSTRHDQDSEWCVVRVDGTWEEVRFHDYGRIYDIEGMYERLFYDVLQCHSPEVVSDLLVTAIEAAGDDITDLRVLDLGAGNGIMAEELRKRGVHTLVGLDILPEAERAAQRDRPGVYAGYHVCDMTALTAETRADLLAVRPTGLACVAALGFGDIPPEAFQVAFDLVADGGWIAFTIKEDFLDGTDSSGFSRMVERITTDGTLDVVQRHRYPHRVATTGDPLHYVAMIGRKRRAIGPN